MKGDVGHGFRQCFDDVGQYTEGSLGYVGFGDGNLDESTLCGVGVGIRLFDLVRADRTFTRCGSLSLRKFRDDRVRADIRDHTLMANVSVDVYRFPLGRFAAKPYLTGGVGMVRNEISSIRFYDNKLVGHASKSLAWQVGGGVGLEVTDCLAFDVGYRYADLGDVESGTDLIGGNEPPVHGYLISHEFLVSARYTF